MIDSDKLLASIVRKATRDADRWEQMGIIGPIHQRRINRLKEIADLAEQKAIRHQRRAKRLETTAIFFLATGVGILLLCAERILTAIFLRLCD